MQFTKTEAYGQKCITYTDSKHNIVRIDFEDDDVYNELLHTDQKFAELSIAIHELMLNNLDWKVGFTTLQDYLIDLDQHVDNVGSFRVS